MSRFDSFTTEELWHLRNGLLSDMGYSSEREGSIHKLYEELKTVQEEKEKARLAALPHCSCCNQILTGRRP